MSPLPDRDSGHLPSERETATRAEGRVSVPFHGSPQWAKTVGMLHEGVIVFDGRAVPIYANPVAVDCLQGTQRWFETSARVTQLDHKQSGLLYAFTE